MAFRISNQILADYVASLGVQTAFETTRLIGIRGAVPWEGDPMRLSLSLRENRLDHWNDTVGVWGAAWALYQATVDPGRYYTQHPMDQDGAAHLLLLEEGGKVWRYQWGMHRGQYEALVQGEPFTVRRDRDKDGVAEPGEPQETGYFGIHIHWGGEGWSVGRWSAGCQVLFGGDGVESPWRAFKATLKASRQETFGYFLIDGWKLARWMGLI